MNKDLIEWNIIFYSAILLIAFVLWILLKYIASVILNLNIENPKIEIKTWEETVLKDPTSKRYLLQSFYPEYFLKKTEEHFNKNEHKSIILVKAGQIANPEYDFGEYCKLSDAVLWIRELDQFIYDPEKHEMFIARLSELNNHFQGKIVVELPFDLDFIDEVYNDYIADNELEKDKKYQYLALQKRWKPVFRNYTGFNGFMIQKSSDEDKQEMIVDALNSCENEIHYSNIWNNLTNYEKIVLFDLADDGLVNIKNKFMINQLIWKGLITLEPYPKLLSDNFRDYIIENLSPGSVKAIESKLGFKGKWKNTRYLILLILIPLAAFILISQGMSIEKIFGIFAGIITVITGAIRLFDSNIFKSAS